MELLTIENTKMKVIHLVILFLVLSQMGGLGKNQTLTGLVTEAIKGLQPREARAEAILERRNFNNSIFDQIISEISNNPEEIFEILASESASDSEKTLVLRLTQSLPATEYLRLIARLLDEVSAEKISPIYLNRSIRVSEKHLRDIWEGKTSSEFRDNLARKLAVYYEGDEIYENFFKEVTKNKIGKPTLGSDLDSTKEREKASVKLKANDTDSNATIYSNSYQNKLANDRGDEHSRNQQQPKELDTDQAEQKSRLPWLVAGLLLLGVLLLLFKTWSGRPKR